MSRGEELALGGDCRPELRDRLQRGSWRWYWNRLRVMEPLELPYRALDVVERLRDEAGARLGGVRAPQPRGPLAASARWLVASPGPVLATAQVQALLEEADDLAQGRLRRLDGRAEDMGMPPDWQRPLIARPAADEMADPLREAIERHRHGHLVRLAQAWHLRRNPRHLAALIQYLETWMDQCPFPKGVAWSSALDAGLRLLNWSITWQLLRVGEPGGAPLPSRLRERWLTLIYVSAGFVRRHRSRHSSANNHLLGELVGLVAARTTWPLWPQVLQWGEAAARELHVEVMKQTHPDGSGCEQASWYQVFVFELLTALVCMQRAQGLADDARLMRRLAAMARFVAAMRDAGGHLSHHGDADHATALPLAAGEPCGYARLLTLALGLGVASDLRPLVPTPAPDSAWLFEAQAGVQHQRPASSVRPALPRAFADGGHYLLGDSFGGPDEILLSFDAGSLGYLGLAAHGHADALSLRLSVGGHPVLVDRGTYTYNGDPAWRRYFRGTAAHNTVTVDDTEQSAYGGSFLWLRKARCERVSFDSQDTHGHVEAWHDGYSALAQPVAHRRRVDWNGSARRFQVRDMLEGSGVHAVLVAWHFAPDCQVVLRGETAYVDTPGGFTLRLRMPTAPASGRWSLQCGGQGLHGWHSPRFGVRVPAPSLLWQAQLQANSAVETWIEIETHQGAL